MIKEYRNKTLSGSHPRILVTEEFVTKNNFTLNKNEEEIEKKIESLTNLFDFSSEVLIPYLSFSKCKERYHNEYVSKIESGEKPEPKPITDIYETVQDMLDYMVFGWSKALDERGISASRTITKLRAWFWLLGREDLVSILEDDRLYNPYGAPMLIKVCNKIGIEVPEDLIEFAQHKQ